MELLAKIQKITLSRDYFVEVEDRNGMQNDKEQFLTSQIGQTSTFVTPSTPYIGNQSINYHGFETPKLGSETPMMAFGAATPRRSDDSDAWRLGADDISTDAPFLSNISTPLNGSFSTVSSSTAAPNLDFIRDGPERTFWEPNMIFLVRSGNHSGKLVVLKSIPDQMGNVLVQLRDSFGQLVGKEFEITESMLRFEQPQKGALVKVINGDFSGENGVVQVF
jgi:hypothetical protein